MEHFSDLKLAPSSHLYCTVGTVLWTVNDPTCCSKGDKAFDVPHQNTEIPKCHVGGTRHCIHLVALEHGCIGGPVAARHNKSRDDSKDGKKKKKKNSCDSVIAS